MAASLWKQQCPSQSGGGACPIVADILSRVEINAAPVAREVCALTAREQQILSLLAQGRTATAISTQLYISRVTVRNHTQHILAKLGLHSKVEAVAYAYRHGLIGAPLPA